MFNTCIHYLRYFIFHISYQICHDNDVKCIFLPFLNSLIDRVRSVVYVGLGHGFAARWHDTHSLQTVMTVLNLKVPVSVHLHYM